MYRYTLRYLPIAEQDLIEIIDYIQNNLQNPIAAENTLSRIETAIFERLEALEAFPIWQSKKKRPSKNIIINGLESVMFIGTL